MSSPFSIMIFIDSISFSLASVSPAFVPLILSVL